MNDIVQFQNVVQGLLGTSKGRDYTLRQLNILLNVYNSEEQQTVRGLAEAMKVAKPNITRAFDRLQSEGLIRRVRDTKDRRSVYAGPTKRGHAFMRKLNNLVEQNHASA